MEEKKVLEVLSALSQETRLHIIRYLISKGTEGAAAGEIAEAMSIISSKASFHLANLEHAGLVTSERQSRKIIYRTNLDVIGQAMSFILNDCCGGHPDIRACCKLP